MLYFSAMTTTETANALIEGLSSVIRGKRNELELFVASFLAGGHVLVEDFPGLGKTTLARTLSRLVGTDTGALSFKRIQFTPDLLPYDITGVDVFNPDERRFSFMPGPVFCDILLADEINRTTPKVQSALLEIMAERQVTIGGETHEASPLFFVVATQNPVETEGTYPLPAAQRDRFMLRLSLGYPDEKSERAILHTDPSETILPNLDAVISAEDIVSAREEQKRVYCHPALEGALLAIVRKTRNHPAFDLGVSPRGALQYLHAACSLALVRGRAWIEDGDLIDLAVPVLAHRVMAKDSRTDAPSILSAFAAETLRKLDRKTDWSKDVPAETVG